MDFMPGTDPAYVREQTRLWYEMNARKNAEQARQAPVFNGAPVPQLAGGSWSGHPGPGGGMNMYQPRPTDPPGPWPMEQGPLQPPEAWTGPRLPTPGWQPQPLQARPGPTPPVQTGPYAGLNPHNPADRRRMDEIQGPTPMAQFSDRDAWISSEARLGQSQPPQSRPAPTMPTPGGQPQGRAYFPQVDWSNEAEWVERAKLRDRDPRRIALQQYLDSRAEPVKAAMKNGQMSDEEARRRLDQIMLEAEQFSEQTFGMPIKSLSYQIDKHYGLVSSRADPEWAYAPSFVRQEQEREAAYRQSQASQQRPPDVTGRPVGTPQPLPPPRMAGDVGPGGLPPGYKMQLSPMPGGGQAYVRVPTSTPPPPPPPSAQTSGRAVPRVAELQSRRQQQRATPSGNQTYGMKDILPRGR